MFETHFGLLWVLFLLFFTLKRENKKKIKKIKKISIFFEKGIDKVRGKWYYIKAVRERTAKVIEN
jgi:hypothetical protein